MKNYTLRLFVSNRYEELYRNLKEQLFPPNQGLSLARRLISIPHANMRCWLQHQLASDLGVATGFELLNEEQAMACIMGFFPPKEGPAKYRPSRLELALALEQAITLNPWKPTSPSSAKMRRHLLAYVDELTKAFDHYGRYGGAFLKDWAEGDLAIWQRQLWESLFGADKPWTYPYAALESLNFDQGCVPKGLQVHFFCHHFLCPLHLTLLNQLSRYCSVNLYMLSPCSLYWNDLLTGKEQRRLESYWEKRGAPMRQRQQLRAFLQDTNPLLAQLGRVGREMATQLEKLDLLVQDAYFLSSAALTHSAYAELASPELHLETQNTPLTRLQVVQADLLLLRNPRTMPMPFSADDDSIQLHALPSRAREIQCLYDICLGLIDKHSNDPKPLQSSDILVLAPDLSAYLPFIEATFNSQESRLKHQIVDLSLKDQSPFIQTYLHLLSLAHSCWEAPALLQLFSSPFFRAKHQLSDEDIAKIRSWIQQAPIYWGEDQAHRDLMMKNAYCEKEMIDQGAVGTWEYGLHRLLLNLAQHESTADYKLPFSEANLLGKLIGLFESLRSDLRPLLQNSAMNLKDWGIYLQCLCDAYLAPIDEGDSFRDYDRLHHHIHKFVKASKLFTDTFRFDSIYRRLQQALAEQTVAWEESDIQTVRFCSSKPNRAAPARVVVLLGMEEGIASQAHSPLDLLRGHPKADVCPTDADQQRYLFLECLLSSKDYFILSYSNISRQDGKEQSPCLSVEELLSYLGEAQVTRRHPFFPFDPAYFEANSSFKSYSKTYFRACAAYCGQQQAALKRPFNEPWIISHRSQETVISLHLRDLEMAVRDPIRLHLNKTLGIYLPHESRREIKGEEPSGLSWLHKSTLRSECLSQSFDQVMAKAKRRGQLPLGTLGLLAAEQLQQDLVPAQILLKEHGPLLRFQFKTDCTKPMEAQPGLWHLPAVKILHPSLGEIEIVGDLDRVTSRGLLVDGKGAFADTVKAWPAFLLLHCPKMAPSLFFLNEGKAFSSFIQDPIPHLISLVDYYWRCLSETSPLMADWAQGFVDGTSDSIAARMERDLIEGDGRYRHFLWAFGTPDRDRLQQWVDGWIESGQRLYGPLARHWFDKGRGSDAPF